MGTKSRIICIKCPAKYKRLHANSECNLREVIEILYKDNAQKVNLDWEKLIENFKKYKNISKLSWEGNYSYFLNQIRIMIGSPNERINVKAILEKLVKNKKMV